MTDPALAALAALLLPACAFVLLALAGPFRRLGHPAAYLSIVFSAGALVAAIAAFRLAGGGGYSVWLWSWIPAEAGPLATVGVLADGDSTLMLVLVALVSFLVQVYSLGYLSDEAMPSLGRYYTYQSLFAFSMMGLVLAPNFVQRFICWELVGLCSYLLSATGIPSLRRHERRLARFIKAGDVAC
jgi:NADH-quinone oxidoreductase subunit L